MRSSLVGSVYTHLFGSHDAFWFIALLFMVVAWGTWTKNGGANANALLNRDQVLGL
jgi:hypothetical protein